MTEIHPLGGIAPISQRKRVQFERDTVNVNTVIAAAERKGYTCSRWEAEKEQQTARNHFELGCWLSHYAGRVGRERDPQVRIDCVRRIWESGITSPGDRFFTVFGFSEREFDTCFEMGDGDKVAAALKAMAIEDPTGPIAAGVRAFKWDLREPVDAAADMLEQLATQLELPEGHRYLFDRTYETTWDAGSHGGKLSAYINPPGADPKDAPFKAEIRVFLDEPRAILFAHTRYPGDAPFSGDHFSEDNRPFVKSNSYDGLMSQIRDKLAPILEAVANPNPLSTPAPMTKDTHTSIATHFVDHLAAYVGEDAMREIAKRNAEEREPMVCHTHDFADANVFMDAAFKAHGVQGDGEHGLSMVDNAQDWNAAWAIARERIASRHLVDGDEQDATPGMRR